MKIGKFTEIQYESIVNMRLRNIAKLEEQKINDEFAKLKERNKEISSILKSKSKLNKLISEELDELSEEYSSDRKTNILEDVSSSKQIKKEIKISNEAMFGSSNRGSLDRHCAFRIHYRYLNIEARNLPFSIKRVLIHDECQCLIVELQ